MSDTAPFAVRDWLRFYSNGGLVIGQVEYVTKSRTGYWLALTDRGEVDERYVQERRVQPVQDL